MGKTQILFLGAFGNSNYFQKFRESLDKFVSVMYIVDTVLFCDQAFL